MGSGRSLSLLESKYRESTETVPTRQLSRLKIWSTRYAWQARIDRAKEIEDEERRKRWQERQETWREDEYGVALKLLERAKQMLTFPIIEMVNEQPDGTVQIVKPAKWKPIDIARFAEVASKLARLAAEMETEKTKAEITGEIRTKDVTYSDDQRANLISAIIDRARTRDTGSDSGE